MGTFYNALDSDKIDKVCLTCVAVRDYTPQRQDREYKKNMITFREGDKFHILDHSDEFVLWFAKSLSTSRKGWIPSSYVMPETAEL